VSQVPGLFSHDLVFGERTINVFNQGSRT